MKVTLHLVQPPHFNILYVGGRGERFSCSLFNADVRGLSQQLSFQRRDAKCK